MYGFALVVYLVWFGFLFFGGRHVLVMGFPFVSCSFFHLLFAVAETWCPCAYLRRVFLDVPLQTYKKQTNNSNVPELT